MAQLRNAFKKDHEDTIQKFARLLEKMAICRDEVRASSDGTISPELYYEVRSSSLNLLARTAGENSIYYQEIK